MVQIKIFDYKSNPTEGQKSWELATGQLRKEKEKMFFKKASMFFWATPPPSPLTNPSVPKSISEVSSNKTFIFFYQFC